MSYPEADLLSIASFYLAVILNTLIMLAALKRLLQNAQSWGYDDDYADRLREESSQSVIYLAKKPRAGKRGQSREAKKVKGSRQKGSRSHSTSSHDAIQTRRVERPVNKDSRLEAQPPNSPRQPQARTQKNELYEQILEEVRHIRRALDKY